MTKAPFSLLTLALSVAAFATAGPALAASSPTTRLAACRTGSCLVVTGQRDSAAALVLINGHTVSVDGQRNWQVRLPLDTVRDWSAPMARTIAVETVDPAGTARSAQDANLPIGLLGHVDLAALVVAVK